MSELPDNRIRYTAPEINFTTDVGITGQDHDSYPAPNQPFRYDWMRIALIGLLANQSSYIEPVEYRDGTLWFDLNDNSYKARYSDQWVNLSEVLSVGDGISLQSWINSQQQSNSPYKGNWSSTKSYIRNDVAFNNGSSWIALKPNLNQEPTVSNTNWGLYAAGGDLISYTEIQKDLISYGSSVTTGSGRGFFHIGQSVAGKKLTYINATTITAGTGGGSTQIQLYNVTTGFTMLSTKIIIESGKTSSHLSSIQYVISDSRATVSKNDLIRVDIDANTDTVPKGLILTLGFE